MQTIEEECATLRGSVDTLTANLTDANEELNGLASDYSTIREANNRMQGRYGQSMLVNSIINTMCGPARLKHSELTVGLWENVTTLKNLKGPYS